MAFDIRFNHPCNVLLIGPSQSGKSTFLEKLLKWRLELFRNAPRKVLYVCPTRSPQIETMMKQGLIHRVIKTLPRSYEEFEKVILPYKNEGALVCIDDGLSQLESYLPKVFEQFTSKNNTTVIFVSQTAFLDSSNFRRLSENTHYAICLRNKRNPSKIRTLAMQADPCNYKIIISAYQEATKPKSLVKSEENSGFAYGYFIFNFSLTSPEVLNYISNIFPNEIEPVTLYVVNKK